MPSWQCAPLTPDPNSIPTFLYTKLKSFNEDLWRLAPSLANKRGVPQPTSDAVISKKDIYNLLTILEQKLQIQIDAFNKIFGSEEGMNNSDMKKFINHWVEFYESKVLDVMTSTHMQILGIRMADPEEPKMKQLLNISNVSEWQPGGPNDERTKMKIQNFDIIWNNRSGDSLVVSPIINFSSRIFHLTVNNQILEVRGDQESNCEYRCVGYKNDEQGTLDILPFAWEYPSHCPPRTRTVA